MKKEINQNNTAEYLSVKQVTKGKDDCISNDYIIDCEMDINLNGGVKESWIATGLTDTSESFKMA